MIQESSSLVDRLSLTMLSAIFVLLAAVLMLSVNRVNTLSCAACEHSRCPSLESCDAKETVMDVCHCCQMCPKQVNETCGGFIGMLGKCAKNLKCFIPPPRLGGLITGHEEGICRELNFTCNGSDCYGQDPDICPSDSDLVFEVFTDQSYCLCNVSRCALPECATGFTPMVVRQGLGRAGICCDEHLCIKSSDCESVICPATLEKECPDDSETLPLVWTDDGCCQVHQGCVCPSKESCPPVECPDGFQVQVVSRATKSPGSCCDKFRCVNETGLTCMYDDREFQNGESWQIEKCTHCTCNDGISRCKVSSCSPPPCGWMVIPDGQCCPLCRGCVSDSGGLYNNSEMWRENDCVTCQCQDGQALCQAEMCAVECAHPRSIPGQCCPVCDEPDPILMPRFCPSLKNCSLDCPTGLERADDGCVICRCKSKPCELECEFGRVVDEEAGKELCQCHSLPARCSGLETCDKKCVYGYKIGRNGCKKCKCNKCPSVFNCTKRCLHGFLTNEDGCQICRCSDAPPVFLPPLTTPSVVNVSSSPGRPCLTSLGVRREDGEAWDDGCRLCFCRNGHEMCSLIACPAPRCDNPVFRIGDCCPSCPGVTSVPPGGERELCQSASGEYHVEGESWTLDACTHCLCHAGTVLCDSPVCSPILCHHPVKPADSCCAVCKGEDLDRFSLDSRQCRSATGVVWDHGQVWWAGPCQSCRCQSGQVTCYSQVCPPLNCNKTVLRKGHCCPTCLDVSRPHVCISEGATYSEGETFVAGNCTECVCRAGLIACLPLACPHLPCTMMIRKKDQCCPVCYDESLLTSVPAVTMTEGSSNAETTETDDDDDDMPIEDLSDEDSYVTGMVALGVLLSLALVAVVILILILLRRRHTGKFKMGMANRRGEPPMTEIKIRPKSTNLDLQGHMPFLDSPTKPVNIEKNCVTEKSSFLIPMLAPDNTMKLNEHHLPKHFSDALYDGKETVANGLYISNNKSFEQV